MTRFLFALILLIAPVWAELQLVSGNGQMIRENATTQAPLLVRAVDQSGRPVADLPVEFKLTRGRGAIVQQVSRTRADGTASATFSSVNIDQETSWLENEITASSSVGIASFYVISVQSRTDNRPTGFPVTRYGSMRTIRGPAGSIVPGAVTVEIAAIAGYRTGQPIPNIGIRLIQPPSTSEPESAPFGHCNAPAGTALSNAQGIATCDVVLNGNVGTGSVQVIVGEQITLAELPIEITRAEPCTVAIVSGATHTFPSNGGSGSVTFTGSCAWTATSSAQWITFSSSQSGTGGGTLTFTVGPNSGAARAGTITVGTQTITVTQNGPSGTGGGALSFAVPATLPAATAGLAYSFAVTASGGTGPYSWTPTGSLPTGLTLNSTTGLISGVPAGSGTFQIPVTLRDAAGNTVAQTFTLPVAPAPTGGGGTLVLATTSFPAGTPGVPYGPYPIVVTGGCQNPFGGGPRVTLEPGGTLPAGISLRTEGQQTSIGGTPTEAGNFSFALRVTDACNASVTRQFTFSVAAGQSLPPMGVTPDRLTFPAFRGALGAIERQVNIGLGTAAVPFTAAASAPWLSVTSNTTTTPATLTIRAANYADLQPGVYTAEVAVISQAPNSPVRIPVTLTITAPPAATVAPGRLEFIFDLDGESPLPKQLTVGATGGNVNYLAVAGTRGGGQWLSVAPAAGPAPATVLVTVNPSGLRAGTYEGNIIVTPDTPSGPVTVPVTLTVRPSGPRLLSVRNGASFREGPIAPGEIVTVFGSGLGPQSIANLRINSSGMLETSLENAKLYFEDDPAPLLHALNTQVTAVAPYWLHGRTSVRVTVEYNGVRSAAVEVPVQDSAPGLFTASGSSQGAILNENGSYNGPANGARPGSIVSLWGTGEGPTLPVGVAGSIISSANPPRPFLPVSVTIGGKEAEILYAGAAPGAVAGLFQVNVRIPEGTPEGPVPVVLTSGTASSQPNVTVYVAPAQQ